jgi:hypothetical protein
MAKQRFDLMYGEKYGDVNDPKTRWSRVGSVFIDPETGRPSVKLDAVPVGKNFDGWLQGFEPRDNRPPADGQNAPTSGSGTAAQGDGAGTGDEPINLDDIPF